MRLAALACVAVLASAHVAHAAFVSLTTPADPENWIEVTVSPNFMDDTPLVFIGPASDHYGKTSHFWTPVTYAGFAAIYPRGAGDVYAQFGYAQEAMAGLHAVTVTLLGEPTPANRHNARLTTRYTSSAGARDATSNVAVELIPEPSAFALTLPAVGALRLCRRRRVSHPRGSAMRCGALALLMALASAQLAKADWAQLTQPADISNWSLVTIVPTFADSIPFVQSGPDPSQYLQTNSVWLPYTQALETIHDRLGVKVFARVGLVQEQSAGIHAITVERLGDVVTQGSPHNTFQDFRITSSLGVRTVTAKVAVQYVPEPTAGALAAIGVVGMLRRRR